MQSQLEAVSIIQALVAGGKGLAPSAAPWLNERRALALERANALRLPSIRDEEWRFTDISMMGRVPFQLPVPHSVIPDISAYVLPEAQWRLVFVDGIFNVGLSSLGAPVKGLSISNLGDAIQNTPQLVVGHLAQHAHYENRLFCAINTAWLRQGAFIHLAKEVIIKDPIHILYINTQAHATVNVRSLVVLERAAQCTVVEDFVGLGEEATFTNAVSEFAVASSARLHHVRVQRETPAALHIAACAVSIEQDGVYQSQSIALGASVSRYELEVLQKGPGVEVVIDGLALIKERQLADTHTLMDHAYGSGQCRQLHKTIVDGRAHAVFNGKVLVREGAQLTQSAQQSRNLLLSSDARVDTKPQLEIFADDVKCAHGATVGQLDQDHLFYLKSRGLSEARARNLLTYAFGAEIVARIPVRSLAAQLERAVMTQAQTTL
jgi:Fe-S cluster assembly protein SufD